MTQKLAYGKAKWYLICKEAVAINDRFDTRFCEEFEIDSAAELCRILWRKLSYTVFQPRHVFVEQINQLREKERLFLRSIQTYKGVW